MRVHITNYNGMDDVGLDLMNQAKRHHQEGLLYMLERVVDEEGWVHGFVLKELQNREIDPYLEYVYVGVVDMRIVQPKAKKA